MGQNSKKSSRQSPSRSSPRARGELSEDAILASLALVDQRIEQQRSINDMTENELFEEGVEGERRRSLTLSIALRDELIEELVERKRLLRQALVLAVEASGAGSEAEKAEKGA